MYWGKIGVIAQRIAAIPNEDPVERSNVSSPLELGGIRLINRAGADRLRVA